MGDMKISHKIFLLVLIAGIALLIVGYTGYTSLDKAGSDMDTMYSQKVHHMKQLGDTVVDLRVAQIRILHYAMLPPEQRAAKKAEINAAFSQFEKDWTGYSADAIKIPGVEERVRVVDNEWKAFKTAGNKTLRLADESQEKAALESYENAVHPQLEKVRSGIEDLQQLTDQNAARINEQNMTDNQSALHKMLGMTILALLLLILLSWWNIRQIIDPLGKMMKSTETLSEGDFRESPRTVQSRDELGKMADILVSMRSSIGTLIRHINKSSTQVAAAAQELTASSDQVAQASEQSASSLAESTSAIQQQQAEIDNGIQAMEKISSAVEEIRNKADQITTFAGAAAERANHGKLSVDESVGQMEEIKAAVSTSAEIVNKLGARSEEIGQIVDTISALAGQTNLLSLNAAIEAASAGEHGRGFSVVAEEVRKLAEQSQQATLRIEKLITSIQNDTAEAVTAMEKGNSTVTTGTKSVEALQGIFAEIDDLVNKVAMHLETMDKSIDTVDQQSSQVSQKVQVIGEHSEKLSRHMQTVSAATEEQSASTQEIASASEALAQLAQSLQSSIQKFRV